MERCGAEEGYTANFKSSSRPPVLSSQNLSLLQSARKMFHNLAISIESGISQERCCWLLAVCRVRAGCLCYHVNNDIL